MTGYFAAAAAGAVLWETACAMAPERWEKEVRRIASLVLLAILLSPLAGLRAGGWEAIAGAGKELTGTGESETVPRDVLTETAELIFALAGSRDLRGAEEMVLTLSEEGGKLDRKSVV